MKTNVDQELKTLRGLPIKISPKDPATLGMVIEFNVSNDPTFNTIESKHKAKKIALKCIQGGEQEFTEDEVNVIIESLAKNVDTNTFCAVESILKPEQK